MSPRDVGTPWKPDLLVLTLFFGAMMLFGLDRMPLANPDEARYAEIAREMALRNDWVTPRLNDTRYFEKPPLVYWLLAVAQWVFGPGEFGLRLVPALFGLGGIVLTYAAGRTLYGRETGLAAAIVQGTCVLYFALSRVLLLDMVVSVLMSVTLYCAILGMREPPGGSRRWLFYAAYGGAALATLTKGLMGVVIPGAVLLLWLQGCRQWHRLRPMYLPGGLALFLILAAPWHVAMAMRNPEWAEFYFLHEHFGRFTTTAHQRGEPWWFFVPVLLLGLFPWTGFLPGGIRLAVSVGWARRREADDSWFFLLWAGFVFLFFSVSQSKLIPYVLPAVPPLALLTGRAMAAALGDPSVVPLRWGFRVFAFACGLLGVAFFAVVLRPGTFRDPAQAVALRPFGLALGVTLLLGGVVAPWASRVRGVVAGAGTIVATMIGFWLVVVLASPDFERAGTRDLALVAREKIGPDDRVYHYWGFFHDFVYYSGRFVGLVGYTDELEVQFLTPEERAERFIGDRELARLWTGPRRVWVVVRKRDQEHPESFFAKPDVRAHVIAESRKHRLLSNRP